MNITGVKEELESIEKLVPGQHNSAKVSDFSGGSLSN